MLRSVTRRSECVLYPERIADTILSVAQDIMTGRPQPGAVEIPTDLLSTPVANIDVLSIEPFVARFDADKVKQAAEMLAGAKRPLLWVGGGCQSDRAAKEIRALAKHLGAPVVSSLNGRGVVPTDDPLFVGSQTHYPEFRPLLEQSDLVLAIGTRFQAVQTWFWSLPMPAKLIHIDIDATMIGRNYPAELGIEGDAAEVVAALLEDLKVPEVEAAYLALAEKVRAALHAATEKRIGADHVGISDAIDRLAPDHRNLVCDATMTGTTWGNLRVPVRHPREFAYSTSLAIGPALPIGLGMALGSGRRTIVVHGDGGVMLNLAELSTAVENNAPLTVLVFNNQGYGGLKYLQDLAGTANIGVDLHTPDFKTLGKAFGLTSWRVDTVAGFEEAFAEAMKMDGPNLIEVDITRMAPLAM